MSPAQFNAVDRTAGRLFQALVDNPVKTLALGLIAIASMTAGLSRLDKDPSTDSLIPQDHPSVAVRDRTDDLFGLRDPMVVAVASKTRDGVFTPAGLSLVAGLHENIEAIDGVRANRVASIASESRVHGTAGALYVDRFFEAPPTSTADAATTRAAVFASPPHIGTLISDDGRMALIVAELYEDADADAAYRAAKEIAAATAAQDFDIHIAGEGAVTGYLSASIDSDGRRLPAIAGGVIFLIVMLAFLRAKALLAVSIIIAAAVGGALGVMSWLGVKYYVITSALPIILIAIAVADAIHILSGYFARRAAGPERPVNDVIVETMTDLWRPLTLTTVTTMAGFFGIAVASIMPPLSYFGWFAMLGTFLAWFFSLFVLPAALALLKLSPSPTVNARGKGLIPAGLTNMAQTCAARPAAALGFIAAAACLAAFQATQVKIDRDRVKLFNAEEPIRIADVSINSAMAGTSYLDVLIETQGPDGLLSASRLERISALQDFMETLPNVNKATAFTDVVSELHKAVNADAAPAPGRPLPSDDDAVAQLLLLYEASGDPEDLADEIDANYQYALVRGYMSAHEFSAQRPAVEALGAYLVRTFNQPDMTGLLSGRVNVDYNWMTQLGDSHVRSVVLSLCLVFLMAATLFRSFVLGALSVAPVLFAILSVYAVMGAVGIYIEPSTSMFAAIAIGVGVDFAVHFIDRLQQGTLRAGLSVRETIARRFPTSARACFINALALGLGFSVLMSSALPTVTRFGLLIAIAAAASFLAGLVVTCAVYALLQRAKQRTRESAGVAASGALLAVAALWAVQPAEAATSTLTGAEIAEKINARAEGDRVERTIAMTKTTRNGSVQERQAMSFRSNNGEGERRNLIVYTAPRSIRGTAFMTHDIPEAADRRWLFLPARGSAMRIPDAERGKYFLGTGFSYEDIKSELKFSADDYRFERLDPPPGENDGLLGLYALPHTDAVARELGYGALRAAVDPQTWMPMRIEFEDAKGRPLKTVEVGEVEMIDGVWTAGSISVDHHQKNHRTVFQYNAVSYETGPPFGDFVPENLDESLDW